MMIQHIECIFYDFDGVMTDNRVLVDQNGMEAVFVNRSDGYAVSKIKELGIPQVIISTDANPVVEKRAEKLSIDVIHNVSDKALIVKDYCKVHGYQLSNVIFMGNDLNDLSVMKLVGIAAAPADAETEILAVADWISRSNGGYGAVRDLYRELCRGSEQHE